MGISDSDTLRAAVSSSSMKAAPTLALAEITFRLSLPKSIRQTWGTISPTQPICPHMDTQEAMMAVAATMIRQRIFFRSMPARRP